MEALDKPWRKSSHSGNGGECVEVGNADDVLVRDTTQAGIGPVLRFSPDAWRRFADQVKRSLGRRIEIGMTGVSPRQGAAGLVVLAVSPVIGVTANP